MLLDNGDETDIEHLRLIERVFITCDDGKVESEEGCGEGNELLGRRR
jgi:hypothetical protein